MYDHEAPYAFSSTRLRSNWRTPGITRNSGAWHTRKTPTAYDRPESVRSAVLREYQSEDLAALVQDGHRFKTGVIWALVPRTPYLPRGTSSARTFGLGREAAERGQETKLGRPTEPRLRDVWEGGYLCGVLERRCERIADVLTRELFEGDGAIRSLEGVASVFESLKPNAAERSIFEATMRWLRDEKPKVKQGRPSKRGRPTKAALRKREQRARAMANPQASTAL